MMGTLPFESQYAPHTPGLADAINRTVDGPYREFVYRALIGFKRDVANIVAGTPREKTLLEQVREEQAKLTLDPPADRAFSALETAFVFEKAKIGWTGKQIARDLVNRDHQSIYDLLQRHGVSLRALRAR